MHSLLMNLALNLFVFTTFDKIIYGEWWIGYFGVIGR